RGQHGCRHQSNLRHPCGLRGYQHGQAPDGRVRRSRCGHRLPDYGLRGPPEATTMTMKRITRERRLTPEEASKYKAIRAQVAEELPDLIARHHQRTATLDQLQEL